jgi:hypothetical protein
MKKKVQVAAALGAVGAPVAGMLMMAGPAQAAGAAPLWRNCTYYGNGVRAQNTNNHVTGNLIHSGTCVWQQGAVLDRAQNGLTERVRFYSAHGGLLRTTWQAGYEAGGHTFFSSTPDMFANRVCQALVANSNHNRVIYGPACENA